MSKVSIRVERTEMSLTKPWVPPTSIQSPSLIGRSISRMIPETKFCTMFCRPKPMPTDSAPATRASEERSMPATRDREQRRQQDTRYSRCPTTMALRPPRSILVLGRTELRSAPCRSRVIPKPMAKTIRKVRKSVGEMRVPPTVKPDAKAAQSSVRSAARAPQISASAGSATSARRNPAITGMRRLASVTERPVISA